MMKYTWLQAPLGCMFDRLRIPATTAMMADSALLACLGLSACQLQMGYYLLLPCVPEGTRHEVSQCPGKSGYATNWCCAVVQVIERFARRKDKLTERRTLPLQHIVQVSRIEQQHVVREP
jgi:hypothetical protein